MDVEDDHIGACLVDRAQRGPSGRDVRGLETSHSEHTAIQLRECDIVFDEENPFPRDHVRSLFNFHSLPNFLNFLPELRQDFIEMAELSTPGGNGKLLCMSDDKRIKAMP